MIVFSTNRCSEHGSSVVNRLGGNCRRVTQDGIIVYYEGTRSARDGWDGERRAARMKAAEMLKMTWTLKGTSFFKNASSTIKNVNQIG